MTDQQLTVHDLNLFAEWTDGFIRARRRDLHDAKAAPALAPGAAAIYGPDVTALDQALVDTLSNIVAYHEGLAARIEATIATHEAAPTP